MHSTSVPLILNTRTANVTPQFHCLYDDDFDTCKKDSKFTSLWQHKARVNQTTKPTSFPSILPNHSLQPSKQGAVITKNLSDNFTDVWKPLPDINSDKTTTIETPSSPSHNNSDNLDQTTTHTRYGRKIIPPKILDPSPSTSAHAYNAIFSQPCSNVNNHLLQPRHSDYCDPNPFASVCETIYSMIATDPDTMHLHEALQQEMIKINSLKQ